MQPTLHFRSVHPGFQFRTRNGSLSLRTETRWTSESTSPRDQNLVLRVKGNAKDAGAEYPVDWEFDLDKEHVAACVEAVARLLAIADQPLTEAYCTITPEIRIGVLAGEVKDIHYLRFKRDGAELKQIIDLPELREFAAVLQSSSTPPKLPPLTNR